VDARSYLRVAEALNAYGLWTSWCSEFLTGTGLTTLGIPYLQRSLRSSGWKGPGLALQLDFDPGGGFGYGNALVDESAMERTGARWPRAVRDHLEEKHRSYLIEGKRCFCALPAAAL
jgi:hypothetical protein